MKTVIIIGGGASGMMAAVSALKNNCKVIIIEKKDRIGTKILVTGNGHCNFTNKIFSLENYYNENSEFLSNAFSIFDNNSAINFFNELGVYSREKNGYFYPYSMEASSILNGFRNALNHTNVSVLTETNVVSIAYKNNLWRVLTDKECFSADSVIIACGSSASDKNKLNNPVISHIKSLNHKINTFTPALTYLKIKEDYIKIAAGVRFPVSVKLNNNNNFIYEDRGELQITQRGISGICIFQLSRFVTKEQDITCNIDFMPDISSDKLDYILESKISKYKNILIEDLFNGLLPKKLIHALSKASNMKLNIPVSAQRKSYNMLKGMVKHCVLTVTGTGDYTESQCLRGGVPTEEINPLTMESKLHKGLYFCGEVIDIDGMCGGYNLQWAWTSGYIAGTHASE